MNEKARETLKTVIYSFSANFVTLGTSALLTLIVPKILGVTEYGFWQLYVFYTTYVGFFHLGLIDGIYLKIGGDAYDSLDNRKMGTQFWYMNIFEVFVALGVILLTLNSSMSGDKQYIMIMTAVCGVIILARSFIMYIFQSTNRIREYARLTRIDRIIFLILVMIYFAIGGRNYKVLILFDIASRFVLLLISIKKAPEIVFVKLQSIRKIFPEIVDNISIGSKLMLGNIAGQLILGIVRMGIERNWDIQTFGKLSLTLSISNMVLSFFSTIGIVIFPILRRTNSDKISGLYDNVRTLMVPFSYFMLFSYLPISYLIGIWLPEYQQSLVFMGMLFPMIIYEGRMTLLINNYLKTLRKERTILIVNVVTLVLSIVLTVATIAIFNNLTITVLLIIFLIGFRCNLAEIWLAKDLNLNINSMLGWETILTIVFIASSSILGGFSGFLCYMLVFLIYLFVYKNQLKTSFIEVKKMIKG